VCVRACGWTIGVGGGSSGDDCIIRYVGRKGILLVCLELFDELGFLLLACCHLSFDRLP
jgi:hypothetical protein